MKKIILSKKKSNGSLSEVEIRKLGTIYHKQLKLSLLERTKVRRRKERERRQQYFK